MAKRRFRIPEVLTEDEQQALLKVPNRRYPTGQRNHLLLHLILDTGLRLPEAIAVRWSNINLNTGKLMVRKGKGAKDRSLWIGDADLRLLRRWRQRQSEEVEAEVEDVFTTLEGKPVSPRYVQQMVKRCAAKAGINKNIHPHTLRHSFATDLCRDTGKIRLVQKALGHANLSTTQIYTHIVDEELEDALKSFRQPTAVAVGV